MSVVFTMCLLLHSFVLLAPAQASSLRAVVQPGDTIGGVTLVGFPPSRLAISESGEVAFIADFLDGSGSTKRGLFTQNRAIALSGDTIDGLTLIGFTTGPGSMNAQADVAFSAVFQDPTNQGGIFFAPGPQPPGSRRLLARPGSVIQGETLSSVGWPSLDDAGNVAFIGFVNNLSSPRFGNAIFTPTSLLVGKGDVIDGVPLDGRSKEPLLTGGGDLRFTTIVESSAGLRSAIFSATQLLRRGGDSIDGKVLGSFFEDASLNDEGEVVFRSVFSDVVGGTARTGFFTTQRLLVATGNVIGGKTLTGFLGEAPTLLDNGGLVFGGRFEGNNVGVFTLDKAIALPGDVVELGPDRFEPLRGVGAVAANNQGKIFFRGFMDGIGEALIEAVADSDGDGIPDEEDGCPSSDTSDTVVIDGCDSTTPNLLGSDGCSIADGIAACANAAGNHGQFQSCVAHLTNELMNGGLLSGSERAAIQSCAGSANIP